MDEKDAEEKHRFPLRGGSCSGLQPFFISNHCANQRLCENALRISNLRHLGFLDHITIKGLVPTSTFQGNRPRTMVMQPFLGAENKRLRCYADLLGHKSIGRPHYTTRNDTSFFILVTVFKVLVFYFLQTWLMDCSMLIHLIIFWHAVNLVMLNDSTHVVLIPNGIDDRQFDQHFSLTPWGAAPKNRPTKKGTT